MTLIKQIERYLDLNDVEPSAFGRKVVNDPHLVFDMRDGRKVRRKVRRKIEAFIKKEKTNGHRRSKRGKRNRKVRQPIRSR